MGEGSFQDTYVMILTFILLIVTYRYINDNFITYKKQFVDYITDQRITQLETSHSNLSKKVNKTDNNDYLYGDNMGSNLSYSFLPTDFQNNTYPTYQSVNYQFIPPAAPSIPHNFQQPHSSESRQPRQANIQQQYESQILSRDLVPQQSQILSPDLVVPQQSQIKIVEKIIYIDKSMEPKLESKEIVKEEKCLNQTDNNLVDISKVETS